MEKQNLLFSQTDGGTDISDDVGREKAIIRIKVERLFGQFDYTLPDADRIADLSKVLILYGENGSGKTTVLQALFHLLSRANNRGHRNALARIPFKRFEIAFTKGGWIAAYRESELLGSYTIEGELENQKFSAFLDTKLEKKKFASDEEEKAFLDFLGKLNQTIYLISADRTIMSDALPPMDEEDLERALLIDENRYLAHDPQFLPRGRSSESLRKTLPLIRAVQLANDWIRGQAIRATTRGTENANTIYADIIKRIAESPHSSAEATGYNTTLLSRTLVELASRNADYARFQFTSPLQVEEILSILGRVDQPTAAVIGNVLEPYLDGTRARLDALETLQKTTATFVENLNSFYVGKTVTFGVAEGLKIRQPDGAVLDPRLLSSGEQQLLLMFCHTVLPRRGQTVFIIDEPELSLNVKWQRRLINALRELVDGAQVQFIFASHSIEFLSEHIEHVVEFSAKNQASVVLPLTGVTSDSSNNS